MFIANFDDFNQYMDSLFAQNSIKDFASYRQALVESKVKRKAKIADTSKKINKLLKQIESARTKIKQATAAEDKKVCGLALNTYISAKQELVKQYNRQKNATLFSELSDNAKIYACSKNLLLKYLPPEFNKLPYLNMPRDEQGNLIFKADQLTDTPLERDIHHIIDYVTSYIENYPENVRGAKHFTGLHKQCNDLRELIDQVDAYFAKLNSPKEKEANRIKKSHSGFEVVMTMPQYGLQAVRLLNKPALQYEGSAMHHCVGSYAARVEKGETDIYSMRLTADETHEMIPIATIEYKDGKISQIKGPHDKEISFAYLQGTRDFILHLTGKKDIAEIASDDTIGDKQNIGLIKDSSGVYRDIYTLIEDENYVFDNIHIETSSLPYIPTNHLSVKTLTVHGKLKTDDLKYLSSINVQSTICFRDLDFEGKHLDLSSFTNTNVDLDFSKVPNLEAITLSDNAKSLSLSGEAPKLKDIVAPNLHKLNPQLIAPQLDFAKLGLSELQTMSIYASNLTSHQIDLSNYTTLKQLIFNSKTGEELHNLIIPQGLKILALTGQFPNLEISGADNLQTLHVSGMLGNDKLDLSSFPELEDFKIEAGQATNWQQIILPEKLASFTTLGEFPKVESIIGAPHLRHLDLEGKYLLLKLSINNWPELTELKTTCANFASPDVNLQNCSNLSYLSLYSSKKGSNCQSLILSDNVEDLRLNGAFPHLNKIRLSSNLVKLDMSGSFGLKGLTLPDKLQSFSYDNETEKRIPIKLNSALQELDLNGKIELNDMLTSLPNLIKLNLDGADISDITTLNLPHICPKLQELNMMDCQMANLRELIAPSDTSYLNMNQSEFPSLEKLDFSAMQLKTFGQIDSNLMGTITISTLPQSMRENIKVDNNNRVLNPMRLRGVVLQEAKLPNLKEIKYPQDVEVIDFALNHFNPYDVVDFKAYPNLRTIETPDLKVIDMTDKKVVDKPQSNIQGFMIYHNRLITRS